MTDPSRRAVTFGALFATLLPALPSRAEAAPDPVPESRDPGPNLRHLDIFIADNDTPTDPYEVWYKIARLTHGRKTWVAKGWPANPRVGLYHVDDIPQRDLGTGSYEIHWFIREREIDAEWSVHQNFSIRA